MSSDRMMRIVRKEMNRRRRYGGAEDVPALLWGVAEVDQALTRAAQCAEEEGFDGDWDAAPIRLEESMEALTGLLRRVSEQRSFGGVREGAAWPKRFPLLTRDGSSESVTEAESRRKSRPNVIRQDAGSRALGDYLSWHWQDDAWAVSGRVRLCGGEYLTREEAWQFLTSPLPKVLGFEDYERLGLCPARTTGRILSKYLTVDGLLWVTNMMMVDPKTHQITATVDTVHDNVGNYCVEVNLPCGDKGTPHVERLVLNLDERNYHYVACDDLLPRPYRVEDGRGREVYFAPQAAPYFEEEDRYVEGYSGSVMGELIAVADFLCNEYSVTIWDMLEAMLTGCLPPQPSVEIFSQDMLVATHEPYDVFLRDFRASGFTAQGPATLTVQPWVTPEALADAWREHRKQNACYSPSEKQADAVQFVLSHTPPGEEFAWESLARQWQEERGELMTRGQLFKQFQRARAAILPGYRAVEKE